MLEKQATLPPKLGKYELLKETVASGVAATWAARDPDGRLVTILRLHKHVAKKVEHAEAFLKEARAAQKVRDAKLVPILETGINDGEVFVVGESVDGETLASLIAAAGAEGLPRDVALRVTLDVLEALAAAHGADEPVTHGELSPWTILVGSDGVSRVSGLGVTRALARFGPHGPKGPDRLGYAAPERVKAMAMPASLTAPAPVVDPRADLFSVGVILWELVAKQRLFPSKLEAAVVQKVLTAPIGKAAPNLPMELEEALDRTLERDPAKRYATANDLIEALEGVPPDQLGSTEKVAAFVARTAGKAISTRRAELESAKPGAGPPSLRLRNSTLLGMAAAAPHEPAPPAPPPPQERVSDPPAMPFSPEPPLASPPPVPVRRSSTLMGLPVPPGLKDDPPPSSARKEAPSVPGNTKSYVPAEMLKADAELEQRRAEANGGAKAAPKPLNPFGGRLAKSAAKSEGPPPPKKPEGPPKKPEGPPKKPDLPPKPEAKAEAKPPPGKPTSLPKPAPAASKSSRPPPRLSPSEALERLRPGSTLGRYEILMPIAKGGMATVWAARLPGSRGFQKIVALKTMLPGVVDDADFEAMFLDEARVASRVRHPNVCEIFDLGEQDEILFIAMEWVEGETLGALEKASRASGGMPIPVLLRLASQICAGLHAAHELRDDDGKLIDLVHRDMSPANVLVSVSGFAKIVDFGIAKSTARLHVTQGGGSVKGKTPYLSPEQLGGVGADRRSDLFSVGCLLYVMATGLHPFRGDTEIRTMENIALKSPVPPRDIAPAVPEELEKIILKALEKEPAKRFATAAEMQRAIDQVLTSLGKAVTDEDVAAFVKKTVGEATDARAAELRAAIAKADTTEKAAPSVRMPRIADPVSIDSMDIVDASSDDAKPVLVGQIVDIGSPSAGDDERADLGLAAPAATDDVPVDDEPMLVDASAARRKRLLQAGVAGAIVGCAVLVGAMMLGGSNKPHDGATTSDSAAAIAAAAPSAEATTTAQAAEPPARTETAPATQTAEPTPPPVPEPTATEEPVTPPPPHGKAVAKPPTKPAVPAKPPPAKPPPAKPPPGKPKKPKYDPKGI